MTQLLYAIQEEAVFVVFVSQHLRHEPDARCEAQATHLIGERACDGCEGCREARELFNRGYARAPLVFREAVEEVEILVRSHES
jgi:hypothetical protein